MIRFWRALARVRWRILVNSLRGNRRRDEVEMLARVGAIVAPIVYTAMLAPLVIVLTVGAFIGGRLAGGSPEVADVVTSAARILLFMVFAAVVVAPLARSFQGATIGVERFQLLPVSRRALHASEVLAVLSDPWIVPVIPGLILLPAGLAVAGDWTAALLLAAAAPPMLFALASFGALLSNGAMLVLRDRRRAEFLSLVVILLLTMSGLILGMMEDGLEERGGFEAMLPWMKPLPSELYGAVLAGACRGNVGSALASIAGLAAVALVLFAVSAVVHRRVLGDPTSGSSARRGALPGTSSLRLPVLTGVVGSVALTQFRTGLRTVRGKLAVFLPFAMLAMMHVLLGRELDFELPVVVPFGPLLGIGGVAFTLLSLQPIMLNQFAIDRAGLAAQFLAPIAERDIVVGKSVGLGLLAALSGGLCFASALAVTGSGSPLDWLAAAVVCCAGFVLFTPFAALISIYLPKPSDLSSLGSAGNAHPLAGLLGLGIAAGTLAPPMTLFAAGILAGRAWLTLAMVAGWLVVAGLVSIPLMHGAAAAAVQRRENLLLVAGGR